MIPVLYTTWNRIDYTKQTLPVLCKNTPKGNIIVIDDVSSDGTQEYLGEMKLQYHDIAVVFKTRHTGLGNSINKFLALTEGEKYIVKVDNDTIVPENWLEGMLYAIEETGMDAIQAKHFFLSSDCKNWEDLETRNTFVSLGDGTKVIKHYQIGGSAVIFRRNLFNGTQLSENYGIYSWAKFQHYDKKLKSKVGFYDGVKVKILDMPDYNIVECDKNPTYYEATRRSKCLQ